MSRRPAGDAIDVHVGRRVRERRMELGMNQKSLAQAIGVSFQQLQKNEHGTNRIGASRMFELSKALNVPISYWFDELPPQPPIKLAISRRVAAGNRAWFAPNVMGMKDTKELIDAYYAIRDRLVRKRLITFIRGLHRLSLDKKS